MRQELMRTRLLVLALLLLLVVADIAFGQFDETVMYRITAKHSGKCLAVANGVTSRRNGDPVIQWDCTEEDSQKWKVSSTHDGYYKITAVHSGLALDVFGGIVSQSNGVRVVQWEFHNGDNQKWAINHLANGYYEIKAKHSGKRLDVNGGPDATGPGPYAQQWEAWEGDNQKWRFTESLPDLSSSHATRTICPSTADQARLGVNLYTTDTGLRLRTSFGVNETVVLTVYNNMPASIYFRTAINPEPLIREEGLQVERLIRSYWVPVFPSGIFGPSQVERENPDGTRSRVNIDYASPTRVMDLRTTMTTTRRWTVPASIGRGTYRLSFAYYRRRDTQGPSSTVCSQTFVVR